MKSPPDEQIIAGIIARGAVKVGRELVLLGIDGKRLDQELETFIRDEGGEPALKGYLPRFSNKPYEWAICLAIDNEVVHGPPIKMIAPQSLITIDLVVKYKGWHADTARTFTASEDATKQQFAKASSMIFHSALDAIAPLQPMNLFGLMVEQAASLKGYSIIEEFCGHGIGQSIHMDPQVLNYHTPTQDVFEIGRSYAVEPVLAIESQYELDKDVPDGWTARANCLASHNEDTVFVGSDGVVNLTGDK